MKRPSVVHSDPDILGGTPVFVGTRVPVQALIDYIEGGHSLKELLDDFLTVAHDRDCGARAGQSPLDRRCACCLTRLCRAGCATKLPAMRSAPSPRRASITTLIQINHSNARRAIEAGSIRLPRLEINSHLFHKDPKAHASRRCSGQSSGSHPRIQFPGVGAIQLKWKN